MSAGGHPCGPIVVTGASGRLGSAVTCALAEAGFSIIAVSRAYVAGFDGMANVTPMTVGRYSDLENDGRLDGAAMMFHFADRAERRGFPVEQIDETASRTVSLLNACNSAGISRFMLASSIYADQAPDTPYGRAKIAAETEALAASSKFAATLVLRFPPVYAATISGLLGLIAHALERGWPLPFASANQPRRFLGISNLCHLVRHLATSTPAASGIYEPSDADFPSLREVCLAIGSAHGRRAKLFSVPGIDALSRANIVSSSKGAETLESLRRDLEWKPPETTVDQLHRLIS